MVEVLSAENQECDKIRKLLKTLEAPDLRCLSCRVDIL